MNKLLTLLIIVVAFTITGNSQTLEYDNGVGGPASIDDGWVSDSKTALYRADDFTLPSTVIINQVEWIGVYAGGNTPLATDNFTINIYADASGMPGALLSSTVVGNLVNRTDSGIDLFGSLDIYEYSAVITDFSAIAGTTYWLVIINDTTGDADDNWNWGSLDNSGNSQSSTDLSVWSFQGHGFDFSLFSNPLTVPTLGEWGLIILTLSLLNISMVFLWRRKKQIGLAAG